MNLEDKQAEALKVLADWSKWLISIESGLSALIIAVIEGKISFDNLGKPWVFYSLVCLFISIVSATILLGGIPWALQNIPKTKTNGQPDVHGITVFAIPLRVYAVIEHLLFIAALIFLYLAVYYGSFAS
jgi:hypothetical protein